MIDPLLAQSFIDRLYKQLKIHINIMNEKAIIIASSRPERIGNFHSCAYKILQQCLTVMATDELTSDLIGVTCPGVNLLLTDGARPIGVIGVSGKPENVLNIARVLRYSFEVLRQCEASKRDRGFPDPAVYRFITALLFDPMPDTYTITSLAELLSYTDHVPRILIKVRLKQLYDGTFSLNDLSTMYLNCPLRNDQDIWLPIDPSTLLLCKAMPIGTEPAALPRSFHLDFIGRLNDFFTSIFDLKPAEEPRYYYSTVVESFQDYRETYHFINWVENNQDSDSGQICQITDYLARYLVELLPENKIRPILGFYAHLVDQYPGKDIFMTTIGALVETGFSTESAARRLFVHKNNRRHSTKENKGYIGIKSCIGL
jgi:carbohydrate diacid regulator